MRGFKPIHQMSISMTARRTVAAFIIFGLLAASLFAWRTCHDLRPFSGSLVADMFAVRKAQYVDRSGLPLSVTYQNDWNIHQQVPLHEIPPLLQQAFLDSEDQRFHEHHGVDWAARLHAVWQNLAALRAVRGASTITEQVVRMLHPRPRTIWSRWLEGIEAVRLEALFPKATIFEFYLNQIPYANQRRGVAQAANLYFDRDLATLNDRELLALAVLVRAPSGMDLRHNGRRAEHAVLKLANAMLRRQHISVEQHRCIVDGQWSLAAPRLPVDASHFIRRLQAQGVETADAALLSAPAGKIVTTLDGSLQGRVQRILDSRLQDLQESGVTAGAVLVVDHRTDEVLAWVNGGARSGEPSAGWIDAVTTPRQPGSTLKPFLYALSLEMGWTPATLIDDSPLAEAVDTGLHAFNNYSHTFYGPLRLRDALANSLNVPAIRTVQYVSPERFLELLKSLGFASLSQPAAYYGAGIALGNGEVSLFELVQAYAALARGGLFRPLRGTLQRTGPPVAEQRVLSEESTSLIADILSDPYARQLEFGQGNLLRLPLQTAVKTGTSNDHRDAWTLGFTSRHTVGVWMGNLERKPTSGITGSSGPALVLRAVFAELNRHEDFEPLHLSARLLPVEICRGSGLRAGPNCPRMIEWFKPASAPRETCRLHQPAVAATSAVELRPYASGDDGEQKERHANLVLPHSNPPPEESRNDSDFAALNQNQGNSTAHESQQRSSDHPRDFITLVQPTPNLHLAMDPRIPDELELFPFVLAKEVRARRVEWLVDDRLAAVTGENQQRFLWPVSRGAHHAQARIWLPGENEPRETPKVKFIVK